MDIRQLVESDVEAYHSVRLRALKDHPESFGSSYEEQAALPLSFIVDRFNNQNLSTGDFMLGAFREGQLVGTVGMYREKGLKSRHKATIVAVYAAPEVRGQGVGKALVSEAIRLAKEVPGLIKLELGVATSNAPARNLYLSLGFEVFGLERKALKVGENYYDEELMVLWL